MRQLKSFAAAAVLAACLFGAASLPAAADIQGGDQFRVVGLPGSQTLKLMNGPARWSGVQVEIPFDARNLRATGVHEGIWVQLSFRAENGYDFTGWVDSHFIAADDAGAPTVFRVVNVGRRQTVPLMSMDGYGVQASISGGTAVLPACGPCQNGYCQVRYHSRRGNLEGLVNQGYLEVARVSDPGYAAYEPPGPADVSADMTYSDAYQPTPGPAYEAPAYADSPVDLLPPPPPPFPHHREWRNFWDRLQGRTMGY